MSGTKLNWQVSQNTVPTVFVKFSDGYFLVKHGLYYYGNSPVLNSLGQIDSLHSPYLVLKTLNDKRYQDLTFEELQFAILAAT
jgi:hypothetical protein